MQRLAWFHLIAALAGCGSDRSTGQRTYAVSELPIARWTAGLPVSSGALTVDLAPVDVTDWTRVTGTVRFDCHDCTLGDDKVSYQWMIGQLDGHLEFDEVHARATFVGGTVHVSVSGRGDIDFDGTLDGTLGRTANETRLDGCLRYVARERLDARDPKLHAALNLLYGMEGDRRHVVITGTLGAPRMMDATCRDRD